MPSAAVSAMYALPTISAFREVLRSAGVMNGWLVMVRALYCHQEICNSNLHCEAGADLISETAGR